MSNPWRELVLGYPTSQNAGQPDPATPTKLQQHRILLCWMSFLHSRPEVGSIILPHTAASINMYKPSARGRCRACLSVIWIRSRSRDDIDRDPRGTVADRNDEAAMVRRRNKLVSGRRGVRKICEGWSVWTIVTDETNEGLSGLGGGGGAALRLCLYDMGSLNTDLSTEVCMTVICKHGACRWF